MTSINHQIKTDAYRFNIPVILEVAQTSPTAEYLDPTHGVTWRFTNWELGLDLRRDYDDDLRSDAEREAHLLFEHYHRLYVDIENLPALTTLKPDWSPIIDLEHVQVGTVPALQIVRRLALVPGNEIIVGSLHIPTAVETFVLTAIAQTHFTGTREAILVHRLLKQKGSEEADTIRKNLPQSRIDDPQLDAQFPDHILTRVRAALTWMRQVIATDYELLQPPILQRPDIELPDLQIALTLPPRFTPLPQALQQGPRTAGWSRSVLPDAPPQLLDVWRAGRVPSKGRRRQDQLRVFAESNMQQWRQEGAKDMEIQFEQQSDHKGMLQGEVYVTYTIPSGATQSLARYLIDVDSEVFRIVLSAPTCFKRGELRTRMDEIIRSFRRLDPCNGKRSSMLSAIRLIRKWLLII